MTDGLTPRRQPPENLAASMGIVAAVLVVAALGDRRVTGPLMRRRPVTR